LISINPNPHRVAPEGPHEDEVGERGERQQRADGPHRQGRQEAGHHEARLPAQPIAGRPQALRPLPLRPQLCAGAMTEEFIPERQ